MKELELYLHIPFCVQKCAYCDFLSAPADASVRGAYVRRLIEEIQSAAPAYEGYRVSSIFFGGGTPSILEGFQIAELMDALKGSFSINSDAEITMECNPGTLLPKKAELMRHSGINRLSLGLQSADNRELKLLGRIHTYEQFLISFELARKAGFDNINVDLMSALPGQRAESWEQTLKRVTLLHPEHISAYSLIIEEGTPFYERYHAEEEKRNQGLHTELLPDEEEERSMYEMTQEILAARGYERYEISNYARRGYECRHNQGYWMRKNYLGLGLGASSLIENERFQNTSNLKDYMEHSFEHSEKMILDRSAQMEEFMFLGLRLSKGISRHDFETEFSIAIEGVYGDVLKRLKEQKLLEAKEGRIYLTERGIDVSNLVLSEFLLPE